HVALGSAGRDVAAIISEPFLPLAVADLFLRLRERPAQTDSALDSRLIRVLFSFLDCGELSVDPARQVRQRGPRRRRFISSHKLLLSCAIFRATGGCSRCQTARLPWC